MAEKKIQSFSTSISSGGTLKRYTFVFTDGTKATGYYNSDNLFVSGDSSAPPMFDPTKQANVKQNTTSNLKNLEKLESKNFVQNNKPAPDYKQNISSAVNSNKPDMLACIGQRLKDIIGIFTLPYGLPLEIPKAPNIPSASIGEIFANIGNQIVGAALSLKNSILGSINDIGTSITSTIEIGDLSVSKFLGCDELSVSTPAQKKELATSPVKQQQVTATAVQTSATNLQQKTETKVQEKVEPVKTSQQAVPAITQVEAPPSIPFTITGIFPMQYTITPDIGDDEILLVFNGINYSNKNVDLLFEDGYKKLIESVNLATIKENKTFTFGNQVGSCDMQLKLTITGDTIKVYQYVDKLKQYSTTIDFGYSFSYTKRGDDFSTIKYTGGFLYEKHLSKPDIGANENAKLLLASTIKEVHLTRKLIPLFATSNIENELPTACKL